MYFFFFFFLFYFYQLKKKKKKKQPLACDKSCKSCDGPSEDDCLSCNDFREILFNDISNTTGQCVCKENTFEFPNSTLGYVNRECWGSFFFFFLFFLFLSFFFFFSLIVI